MTKWKDSIDPATIPDEVIFSEFGRRANLLREVRAGGRPKVLSRCPRCRRMVGARERREHASLPGCP